MESNIRDKIDEAIEKFQPIKIRLYALLPKTEEELNYITTKILDKAEKDELISAVYTAVKELALNGAKANIKRIFFDEQNANFTDDKKYEEAMKGFKAELNTTKIHDYALKAKNRNLYVDVNFDYNKDRLILKVVNNSALSRQEDERIRKKFKDGNKYDNIAEFYMDTMDNAEGAGMGITLIMMLLKSEGIDPHLFTIVSDFKNKTEAKLEFPFQDSHLSSREKFVQENQ